MDRAPASRAIAQVMRCGDGADDREREVGDPRGVPERGEERDLDEGRERHPVRVRGDGQGRVGGDRPTHLGEDPDEVDVEAVTGQQRVRDVDVIGRVGVGREREVPDEHHPDGEGEPVQQ